jgi:hypothetical protein
LSLRAASTSAFAAAPGVGKYCSVDDSAPIVVEAIRRAENSAQTMALTCQKFFAILGPIKLFKFNITRSR